jgi:hypothetical protein
VLTDFFGTIAEINEGLPNGLHDAEVEKITEDLHSKTLSFQLFVWVGTMDDPPSQRERYRRGKLIFDEVRLFSTSHPLSVDADRLVILTFEKNSNLTLEHRAAPPFGDKDFRMFLGSSEIDIAAGNVRFEWIEAEEVNREPDAED